MKESLLAFKYFFWADKKLHHVSYTENKEDIDEDLLCDFLGAKKKLRKAEKMALEEQKMQMKKGKISLEEELAGASKRAVDIQDQEDFPTLGAGVPKQKAKAAEKKGEKGLLENLVKQEEKGAKGPKQGGKKDLVPHDFPSLVPQEVIQKAQEKVHAHKQEQEQPKTSAPPSILSADDPLLGALQEAPKK